MPEISISQVEYSSSPDGPVIHIFGRTASGEAKRVDVTSFRPYFYAEDKTLPAKHPMQASPDMVTEYKSILGDSLRRIYTAKPSDVRDIRERYKHFEADIPFSTRFMIDLGLTGGISFPDAKTVDYHEVKPAQVDAPSRVCVLDIECDDSKGFPDPQRDPIICITCYDSFHENYTSFVLTPNGNIGNVLVKKRQGGLKNGCFREDFHEVATFTDEPSLLRAFVSYIHLTDPDILTGWNFVQFDMPYILGRMDRFGMKIDHLARLPGASTRLDNLRGRALFDLLEAYKKMHQQQKQSYRLDAIAFEEVGEQKVRFKGTLSDLWKNDPADLVEYNFKDVELCVAIEKKNEIVAFFREIARYVGMPLDKTLNSSSVVDTFVLHKAHDKFVLPSKKGEGETHDFEGATVFPPVKGLHENVVVLDLKSLYPMIMMTINASPETKNPHGELITPNGVRFKKEPDGIVRTIIMDLLKERDEKKALRNKYKFGSREYKIYDMQQSVLKIVMNTYYGVSGYAKFRLSDYTIGAAVTSVGRAILEHSRAVIEKEGYTVIYGDTDSCGVKLPMMSREDTIKEAKRLEKLLNDSYGKFAKDILNADVHYFSTKFEKLYARFFSGGRKKRYAGLLVWKEGKDVDEVDIVGFESKRSDTPQLTKEVQTKLMDMILHGRDYGEIRAYMRGILKQYRAGKYPLDMIGIPGGFSKAFSEYETKDAHMRGAEYANRNFKTSFGKASKPKRVYVKAVPPGYEKTDVICFEYPDQVPAGFVVDYELMLEKNIQKPIERIVSALDWNWIDFDPTHTTLSQWGM